MAGLQKASGGKKNRKVGRKKTYCEAYRRENRGEKNKAYRLIKHIARQPNDKVGAGALERCYAVVNKATVAKYIEQRYGVPIAA